MSDRNVPFPEAGADAFVRLDLERQQELFDAFGQHYISVVELGLTGASPVITTRCLAVMLQGEDEDGLADCPWNLSVEEIGGRLLDAWNLARFGKTTAEISEEQAAIAKRTLEYFQELCESDPQAFEEKVSQALSAEQMALNARIARRKAEAAVKAEAKAEAMA